MGALDPIGSGYSCKPARSSFCSAGQNWSADLVLQSLPVRLCFPSLGFEGVWLTVSRVRYGP